jgi:regulator of RNase E activity RraA
MAGAATSLSSTLVPVSCGGVTVAGGDFIIGDDDGIVVASESELTEIVPAAEEIQRQETEVLRRVAAGESLFAMLNLEEHLDAVGSGKKSKLRFIL